MVFDIDLVEHDDGWFATGTLDSISVDNHLVTLVNDNKRTTYAVSPLMHVVSWDIPDEWIPIGLCADFFHGLLLGDGCVIIAEFQSTGTLFVVDKFDMNNVQLIAIDENEGLVVANSNKWVRLANNGMWFDEEGAYSSSFARVEHNAVVVNNQIWQYAVVNHNCTLGVSGDDALRVVSGKRAECVARHVQSLTTVVGKYQQQSIRTCAGVVPLVNDNDEWYMTIDNVNVTQYASTEKQALITPMCRVVTTNEYVGVADLLTNTWMYVNILAVSECLAISDGEKCVRVLTKNKDMLTLSEVSLGISRVREIGTWQLSNVQDAVIVTGRKVMAISENNVYVCEFSKQPVAAGTASSLIDVPGHDPILVSFVDNENLYKLNGVSVQINNLPRCGLLVSDNVIINNMLIGNDEYKLPANAELPNVYQAKETHRLINVSGQIMVSDGQVLVPIDVVIDDDKYTITCTGKGHEINGLVVAAVKNNKKICAVVERDSRLYVIKRDIE